MIRAGVLGVVVWLAAGCGGSSEHHDDPGVPAAGHGGQPDMGSGTGGAGASSGKGGAMAGGGHAAAGAAGNAGSSAGTGGHAQGANGGSSGSSTSGAAGKNDGGHGGTNTAGTGNGGASAGTSGTAGSSAGSAGSDAGAAGAGGSGTPCGGRTGGTCPTLEYCKFANGLCGSEDSSGTCVTPLGGALCAPVAVCGCNGTVYRTACDAYSNGVDVWSGDAANSCVMEHGDVGAACMKDDDCSNGLKCCGSPIGVISCTTPMGSSCPLTP